MRAIDATIAMLLISLAISAFIAEQSETSASAASAQRVAHSAAVNCDVRYGWKIRDRRHGSCMAPEQSATIAPATVAEPSQLTINWGLRL